MRHQLASLKHDDKNQIIFDNSDAGTGKTAVRLWGFASRRKKKGYGALLVIATKSLLDAAWAKDIRTFTPYLRYSIARAENREKAFAADADIYITNHDAVKWLALQPASFFARFSEIVIDESTAFKHATSQRSKAAAKIIKHFERRALLTATPTSNSITDIWHQAFLLDGGRSLGTSFYAFRNAVCTPVQVGRHAQALKWTDKLGANDVVFGQLGPMIIRHVLNDCVDMPGNRQYTMEYELPKKQMAIYRALEEESILVFKNAKQITAINAAAVHTKLLQVASGAVYRGDSEQSYELVDTGRYELVLDLVAERPSALVFFLWRHQCDYMVEEAKRRGLRFAVLDGRTPDRVREEAIAAYQAGRLDVLFAHPATAAHGLTLTRGTSTIWASPTYNLELFIQGSSRQHRVGQTRKCETIVVIAPGTKDEDAWEIMQGKSDRMTSFLKLAEA
jgi:SNF2 family DNA or RNA helicase